MIVFLEKEVYPKFAHLEQLLVEKQYDRLWELSDVDCEEPAPPRPLQP